MTARDDMVKMAFPFTSSTEERSGLEWLWVRRLDGDVFEVCNIPTYARAVAFHDHVTGVKNGEGLAFGECVSESGHSTLHVYVLNRYRDEMCAELNRLGCAVEKGAHLPVLAVDVPPEVELNAVRRMLDEARAAERADYAEPALSTLHRAQAERDTPQA